MSTEVKWIKIAEAREEISWKDNNLATVQVGTRVITIGKYNNQLFACPEKCPHASGALSEGFIDAAGNIVCPLHRYKFSLINGRNVSGEGYFLKLFCIEERVDGVFIELPVTHISTQEEDS